VPGRFDNELLKRNLQLSRGAGDTLSEAASDRPGRDPEGGDAGPGLQASKAWRLA